MPDMRRSRKMAAPNGQRVALREYLRGPVHTGRAVARNVLAIRTCLVRKSRFDVTVNSFRGQFHGTVLAEIGGHAPQVTRILRGQFSAQLKVGFQRFTQFTHSELAGLRSHERPRAE
jgi:hypothetical protein